MTYYWRHLRLNSTLDIFNSQYPRLQFTMEIESDRLNFLAVTVIRDNVLTEFNWYHKPTFSGRYLNFWSQHPVSQKIDQSIDNRGIS